MRAVLLVVALLLGTLPVSGCGGDDDAPMDRLVIATGPEGSVYDRLGRALAAAANRHGTKARTQATSGSVDNLRMVGEGRADLAFATVDAAAAAVQADTPFVTALPIMALAGLYDDYLHVVVRADSRIDQIGDLNGKAVSTGAAGSGTEIVAARVLVAGGLGLHRITRSNLAANESAEALREGRIDGFFVTGGLPTPAVADLAARTPIRVLSVHEELKEIQERSDELYLARTISVGTYGLEKEVETLGVRNVLVVRWDMRDEVARWLTGLLFGAKDQLVRAHQQARRIDLRSASATYPMPLHPGAQRWYRNVKPMS